MFNVLCSKKIKNLDKYILLFPLIIIMTCKTVEHKPMETTIDNHDVIEAIEKSPALQNDLSLKSYVTNEFKQNQVINNNLNKYNQELETKLNKRNGEYDALYGNYNSCMKNSGEATGFKIMLFGIIAILVLVLILIIVLRIMKNKGVQALAGPAGSILGSIL